MKLSSFGFSNMIFGLLISNLQVYSMLFHIRVRCISGYEVRPYGNVILRRSLKYMKILKNFKVIRVRPSYRSLVGLGI